MRSRKMIVANTMLVFSCLFTGVISSIGLAQFVGPVRPFPIQLVIGTAPGVMLSLCLALGVILINYRHRDALNRGEQPGWNGVLIISLAMGCLAVLLIIGVRSIAFVNVNIARGFVVPPLPVYALFPSVMAYTTLFLIIYHARRYRLWGLWFIFMLFGGVLAGMVWGASHFLLVQDVVVKQGEMATQLTNCKARFLTLYVGPLFKGLPFAFFWGLAAQKFNPAHTLERWKELHEIGGQNAFDEDNQ
jgi:hypothetical protein